MWHEHVCECELYESYVVNERADVALTIAGRFGGDHVRTVKKGRGVTVY